MIKKEKSRVMLDVNRLESIMWEKKITWAELARMMGQSRQNLYWKKKNAAEGHYSNLKTVFQIADVLGVEPEDFLERID